MLPTAREREVAALIAPRYTNQAIAEVMVIAERTAETHARNLREKLSFSTRARVAARPSGKSCSPAILTRVL